MTDVELLAYGLEQYKQGQRDALAGAMQRVEEMSHEECGECCTVDVIAAIKGES